MTILAMTTPADGPLGDSAIVLDDGSARVLNQNDARPGDLDELRDLGPFDAQLLQFSGAIWFPIAYDFPPDEKDRLARNKRADEMDRAQRYIEAVGATHVFPCAGPPCFLDPDLYALNDVDDDPANIFPDQTRVPRSTRGPRESIAPISSYPDRSSTVERDSCTVTHPDNDTEARARSTTSAPTSTSTAATGPAGSSKSGRVGRAPAVDIVGEVAAWFEPLLDRAPITSAGIAGQRRDRRRRHRRQRLHRLRRVGGARRGATTRGSTRSTSTAR